ncbi:MAG: type IV pilin protein [Pseudomonadota bacterium]
MQNRTAVTTRPSFAALCGAGGFSLIELMAVIVIIGILAAIAYPNYQDYVRATRRAAAAADLMENAQFLERYYTENYTYVGATLPITESPKDGSNKFYDLSFASGMPTATTYTIRAVPKNAMSGDTCGTLTLTHTGVKGVGGSTVDFCWKQ